MHSLGTNNPNLIRISDYFTVIKFSKNGEYIAAGDNSGRLMLFQKRQKNEVYRYRYETETPSMRNLVIDDQLSEEQNNKISSLCFLTQMNYQNLHILSTNEKSIHLWRFRERCVNDWGSNCSVDQKKSQIVLPLKKGKTFSWGSRK